MTNTKESELTGPELQRKLIAMIYLSPQCLSMGSCVTQEAFTIDMEKEALTTTVFIHISLLLVA